MNAELLSGRDVSFKSAAEGKEEASTRNVGLLIFTTTGEQPRMLLRRDTNGFAPPVFGIARGQDVHQTFGAHFGKTVEVARSTPTVGKGAMRILSTTIDTPLPELPGDFILASKSDIQGLGRRDTAHRRQPNGGEWDLTPGLDSEWYDNFQRIGIIDDPDKRQRGSIPDCIYGRTPIAGRYYGEEYKTTQAASKALASIGIEAYPKPDAPSITINSEDGDTFSFLGGDQLTISPYLAQLGFFRQIERSHDIPMVNRFVYVAINNGYLGRTASIEVAYATANNKRLIFSESPTRFSPELPPEIVEVVQENYEKFPHLPIQDIPVGLNSALAQEIEEPIVNDTQKEAISASMVGLISDLRAKFGVVQ